MKPRAKIWAVIPVKHLSHAKSRLGHCLGDHRLDFARWTFLHTLHAAQDAGVFDGILVVTPDAGVAELAEAMGAKTVADQGNSLNDACSLGLSLSRLLGADLTVFVHADLALLRPEDIGSILESYHSASDKAGVPLIGLVRCKDGEGTNVVICSRNTPFVPHFGPQSFAHHAAESPYCELSNGNAAFDIDTGRDLLGLLACRDQLDPADPIAIMLEDDRLRMKIAQCCA